MPDKDIQNWLRKIGQENVESLVKALMGADAEVQDCVFRNMSSRAKIIIKEDIRKHRKTGVSDSDIQASAMLLERMFN